MYHSETLTALLTLRLVSVPTLLTKYGELDLFKEK